MTSRTMRLSPCVACVQSTGATRDATAHPAFVFSLRGPVTSTYSPCSSVVHGRQISLDDVCIIQVFFSFFCFFLQLRFSCFHPQNKFSSKIAIKSLWKFMSIVAAIWKEKRTIKYFLSIYYSQESLASEKWQATN